MQCVRSVCVSMQCVCSPPISPSTGQHLVDADHVEGVQAHTDVEAVLSTRLHHVLVSTDTGRLQS